MEIILLAVIAGLQAATLAAVILGTNVRDRLWQVPVIGNILHRIVRNK